MGSAEAVLAGFALRLFVAYAVLFLAGRMLLQWRTTGSSGFKALSAPVGSASWVGEMLIALAILLGAAAPVAARFGWMGYLPALDGRLGHAIGLTLYVLGATGTFAAQITMGRSWRIGVDPTERTALVTGGLFRVVRNPIYTSMLMTAVGLVLFVPNLFCFAAVASLLVGIEVHVRLVEEPYLLRTHGDTYAEYAARVGQFIPGVGRLSRKHSRRGLGPGTCAGHLREPLDE